MRVEFTLKFRDYFLFQYIHALVSPLYQILTFGFAARNVFDPPFYPIFSPIPLLEGLGLYLCFWILLAPFIALVTVFGNKQTILSQHTIELSEEGVRNETPFFRSITYWHGVRRCVRRPGFVAIYIAPLQAFIIPSRAFASHSERDAFVAAAKAQIK